MEPTKRENSTDCRRLKKLWGDQATLTVYSKTRTLLVALSLACLEMSFVVKGAGAVMLLFRLKYKTSAICHNVNTQKVKIARRDRPHILAYILTLLH